MRRQTGRFTYFPASCPMCGLVQQKAYYSPAALNLFYRDIYRNVYDMGSPEDLFKLQVQTNKPWNWINETLGPDQETLIAEQRPSVLDIGCGAGGSLLEFKDAGWNVVGLDYDTRYVNFGKQNGLDLRLGGFENLRPDERFDLIIISHVLEHVEPAPFLAMVSQLIKPEGRVYVEVPSLDSVCKGAYGFDLGDYWQNAHVVHFTELHFRAFACRAQFRVESINSYLQASLVFTGRGCEPDVNYDELKRATGVMLGKLAQFQRIKRSLGPLLSILVRIVSILRMNQLVRNVIFPRKD